MLSADQLAKTYNFTDVVSYGKVAEQGRYTGAAVRKVFACASTVRSIGLRIAATQA